MIRVWGVLNTYRPPGQTSWSRALVRHRIDPRFAIAAVLGLAVEDIQVREVAGSESAVKASTVPSNPSPNTRVAAWTRQRLA
jgi:hypothetical protein